jgi:hypothetical protein
LPQQTDNSDHSNELTPPELNPLLNPLLGQHMGRWAEVYFTSPPEKREQAVCELLRELEAEQSSGTEAAPVAGSGKFATHADTARKIAAAGDVSAPQVAERSISQIENLRARLLVPQVREVTPVSIACSSCGFDNPASQRFCGMCGTRLGEAAGTPSANVVHSPSASAETDRALESNRPNRIFGPHPNFETSQDFETNPDSDRNPRVKPDPTTHALDEFPWRRDETSLFRIAEEVRPRGIRGTLFADSIDGSTSYRSFFVPAVAVVVLALGYGAWRAMQNQSTAAQPNAPVVQEQNPASAPAANPVQSPGSSEASTTQPSTAQPSNNAGSASAISPAGKTSTTDSTLNHDPGSVPASAHAKGTAIPAAPLISQTSESGATDLATGRSYLDGSNGHERNSSEAAGWLWRAVSKQNAEATLLLSDLYLKGDGVAKNCDQARILLDAAASKGMKDAAQRLRNLQAFGCQ